MAATRPRRSRSRHWRAVRESLYREHPQSPVPPDARADFRAAPLRPRSEPPLRGRRRARSASGPGRVRARAAQQRRRTRSSFSRVGRITLPFPSGGRTLSVFWMAGYAGGLFIPFRDATNGVETYAAGRYLVDAAKSADLGGDPAPGTLDRRLQLRVPAVVRLRPALGLPAGAAGEPARPAGPRRRAPGRLTAPDRLGTAPDQRARPTGTVAPPNGASGARKIPACGSCPRLVAPRPSGCSGRAISGSCAGSLHGSRAAGCSSSTPASSSSDRPTR